MPTATEGSAPKAAAKPKAPAKPKAAAGDAKPAAEKKPATEKKPTDKKPADKKPADKKPADKKPAEKKPVPADKKQGAADDKPADKKQHTPAAKKIEEVAEEAPAVPVYVPKLPVTLAVLNTLEWASCAKVLGNLLNFTPSLGAAIAQLRPFRSAQHLVDVLNQALDALPATYIESFLKRFNEMPLIPKDKLTKEHKCCVGLDALTEEQKSELAPLYSQYREHFGFPFVVCAREAKAAELAAKLKSHLHHEKAQELESGRKEVKKIARLRLLEVVVA